MAEEEVGTVSTFFARPVVAGLVLKGSIKVGDTLHIVGHTTDLNVTVESMQVNNVNVTSASPGQEVGIKVPTRVRGGDKVFKVTG
jgi:putative protease